MIRATTGSAPDEARTWAEVVDEQSLPPGEGGAVAPSKWDLRKIRTRRAILAAGREIFASQATHAARVEDVAKAAGISRAAFYLHFKSLEELMVAVFRREVRWQLRRYRSLDRKVLADRGAIAAWLKKFFVSFRNERHYILIIYRTLANDPTCLRMIQEERDTMIAHLGKRVPELALFDAQGRRQGRRFIELHHVTRRLEDISLYSAFNSWSEGIETAVDLVTDELFDIARRG